MKIFKTLYNKFQKIEWQVSRNANVVIRHNSPKLLSGEVLIKDDRYPVYFTLHSRASRFERIRHSDGLPLKPFSAVSLNVDCLCEGEAKCNLIVLEYDENGERVGTYRASNGQHVLYRMRENVARIVPALRCFGVGRITLYSLSARVFEDFAEELSKELFGDFTSEMPKSEGAILLIPNRQSKAFTLTPHSKRRFVFPEISKGHWSLEIQHEDRYLLNTRKALIARFGLTNTASTPKLASDIKLGLCKSNHLFSYMGGGIMRDGIINQRLLLDIPQRQDALIVEIELPIDRYVNIDSLVIKRKLINDDDFSIRDKNLKISVRQWLNKNPFAKEAHFILYSDINLNVVDGSSIWLSSMASILCMIGKCILIAKTRPATDIVLSNVRNAESLTVLSPDDLGINGNLNPRDAASLIRYLDDALPDIRHVVVRGLDEAVRLAETRQFKGRSVIYLTNFYIVDKDGLRVSEEQKQKAIIAVTHAGKIMAQTAEIALRLREVTGLNFKYVLMPPPIPDDVFPMRVFDCKLGQRLMIGYAGKINPEWGITELLDWVQQLRERGFDIQLNIVANKISQTGGNTNVPGFRQDLLRRFESLKVSHYTDFNRMRSMQKMAEMDYVWCWRPPELEDHTLELSTKLVEMVANGARCICYPSAINKSALGDDYPYFIKCFDDLVSVLSNSEIPRVGLSKRIRDNHDLSNIASRLTNEVFAAPTQNCARRICFSGHDFKFIDPFISQVKSEGHHVIRDAWEWGAPENLEATQAAATLADVVVCEWGLANAVWYSQYLESGKKLFIRIHLQEINDRARKFGYQINIKNVEKLIFVSERVRDRALELFGWPKEKTVVIPNFVLIDEYIFRPPKPECSIRLGMVGIVPERKRFDRAVDLLIELQRRGHNAELHIKGPRPEELEFMRGASRKAELDYYDKLYKKIENNPAVSGAVHFSPWGNDVSFWYGKVDHILSCSDFESFHYALADGVLSGCHPLVWPWEEAEKIYTSEWIVDDIASAADRIELFHGLSYEARLSLLLRNREIVEQRYGHEQIFRRLKGAFGLSCDEYLAS